MPGMARTDTASRLIAAPLERGVRGGQPLGRGPGEPQALVAWLPPNGRHISIGVLHVFEFRDGLISRENV